jgi:tRNA U34 5-methylaminomethyl-2-thiouridine-forming methyltransferase MnmC
MNRIIALTADGSHTIAVPEMEVSYHSKHGAIMESTHVFIEAGLQYLLNRSPSPISLLEIGFGTGLNALLTAVKITGTAHPVYYTSIEPYPLTRNEFEALNYGAVTNQAVLFEQLHHCNWEEWTTIHTSFQMYKHKNSLQLFSRNTIPPGTGFQEQETIQYDCIYFDAFSPVVQPELWSAEIFSKLFDMLKIGGILTTYCSKTVVRRAMEAAGFTVTKIQGPHGKREMVRAVRN